MQKKNRDHKNNTRTSVMFFLHYYINVHHYTVPETVNVNTCIILTDLALPAFLQRSKQQCSKATSVNFLGTYRLYFTVVIIICGCQGATGHVWEKKWQLLRAGSLHQPTESRDQTQAVRLSGPDTLPVAQSCWACYLLFKHSTDSILLILSESWKGIGNLGSHWWCYPHHRLWALYSIVSSLKN